MPKPAKPRGQLFADMNFKNHFLEGFVWPVVSTRTGDEYSVELTSKGFTCNCQAGSMRGKCKHAQQIHDLIVCDEDVKYAIN